jgi:hypothetical protein
MFTSWAALELQIEVHDVFQSGDPISFDPPG